jgi:cell division septation protein DedD
MSQKADPAGKPDANDEALVITAPDGSAYAVPLQALAQWRLSDEVTTQLRESQEVSGYIIIVGGYQALGLARPGPAPGGSSLWR